MIAQPQQNYSLPITSKDYPLKTSFVYPKKKKKEKRNKQQKQPYHCTDQHRMDLILLILCNESNQKEFISLLCFK